MPSIFSVCCNGDWKGSGEGFIILIQSQREDKYKPFFSSWPRNTKPLGDFHKDGINVAFNTKSNCRKWIQKHITIGHFWSCETKIDQCSGGVASSDANRYKLEDENTTEQQNSLVSPPPFPHNSPKSYRWPLIELKTNTFWFPPEQLTRRCTFQTAESTNHLLLLLPG